MYSNACLGLALSDGTLSFCTDGGSLSYTQKISSFDGGYPLFGAALCGDSYPESVFALIPDAYRQRTAFVRFLEESGMIPIAARDPDAKRSILITSPGGKRAACLGYDYASHAISGRLLDLEQGLTGERFALAEPGLWADPGRITLTDEGLLLLGDRVFDPESGRLSARGETEAAPAELTAAMLPEGIDLPSETAKLLLTRDGNLLLAFSGTGELRIFDASGGALRLSASFGGYNLQFASADAHYGIAEIPDEERMLIFYDDLNRDEAVCIALDLRLWECVGVYEGAAAYLPAADRMLVCHNLDDVWLSPRWSLERMTEKAEGILGRTD